MEGLRRRLAKHSLIGLDTSIFIYHFEAHPTYQPLTTIILNNVQTGKLRTVVSTVAVMELTVQPWRINQPHIAQHYEALLVHFPHLALIDVTRDVARKAAQLRAAYSIRPADALHVATSIVNQATAFITNDKGLSRLHSHLEIITLDSLV